MSEQRISWLYIFGFSTTSLTNVTKEEKQELSLANKLPSASDCITPWLERDAASRKSVNTLQEGTARTYKLKI